MLLLDILYCTRVSQECFKRLRFEIYLVQWVLHRNFCIVWQTTMRCIDYLIHSFCAFDFRNSVKNKLIFFVNEEYSIIPYNLINYSRDANVEWFNIFTSPLAFSATLRKLVCSEGVRKNILNRSNRTIFSTL